MASVVFGRLCLGNVGFFFGRGSQLWRGDEFERRGPETVEYRKTAVAMGQRSSSLFPIPAGSLEQAQDNVSKFLPAESVADRANAQAALTALRVQRDQPRGYTAVPLQLRPKVVDFLENHQMFVHHKVPGENGLIYCDIVV